MYKQAEKAKQDEKEARKLQDNVQALQLRLAAREHICKNLQEKVQIIKHILTIVAGCGFLCAWVTHNRFEISKLN